MYRKNINLIAIFQNLNLKKYLKRLVHYILWSTLCFPFKHV